MILPGGRKPPWLAHKGVSFPPSPPSFPQRALFRKIPPGGNAAAFLQRPSPEMTSAAFGMKKHSRPDRHPSHAGQTHHAEESSSSKSVMAALRCLLPVPFPLKGVNAANAKWRKIHVLPRKDRQYGLKRKAFQTENALRTIKTGHIRKTPPRIRGGVFPTRAGL